MCDLDAACTVGTRRDKDTFKSSSAYVPPELARHIFCNDEAPVIDASFDIWSLGILLFELCTGKHLFPQDISNDNLVNDIDKQILCAWHTITDSKLNDVFPDGDNAQQHVADAKDLIRWCLKGEAQDRPSLKQILHHRFLNPDASLRRIELPREYHFFISHSQSEASGDVGTMFHYFESVGIHVWRDMNADDLTERGMMNGVINSDCLILLLTNNVLSRRYCVREIGWAIEHKKPIIIVNETDKRFYPWNKQRWMDDRCTKNKEGIWVCDWLQLPYATCAVEQCPSSLPNTGNFAGKIVQDEVIRQDTLGSMIPFRRRGYEAEAMFKAIIERAGKTCSWGHVVDTWDDTGENKMQLQSERRVLYIFSEQDKDGKAIALDIQVRMQDMSMSTDGTSTMVKIVSKLDEKPTHVLVVLTKNILDGESRDLLFAVHDKLGFSAERQAKDIIYVYKAIGDHCWTYDDKNVALEDLKATAKSSKDKTNIHSIVSASLQGHEALVYRSLEHEKIAMSQEIFRRMKTRT